MFKVSKFSKSVVLSAMASLVLAGCSGGEESSTQEELNLSNDTAVAFVSKSAASESQANLAQFEQTFQSKTRSPLAASSPYRVNFGATLNLKTSLDINSRSYAKILDAYFGSSEYDVKDLATSADGKTLLFAAHGPETSATDNTWNIYRMDFDTMTVSRIIKDDAVANSGQDTNPTFTRDSKRIVFSTDRAAGNPNSPVDNVIDDEPAENCTKVDANEKPSLLHSMKLDGSEILQLTYGNNHDISPVTMNDGRISFIRVWQSFTSVAQQCGANLQKTSASTQAASALFGSSETAGLDKPGSWNENAICQYAIDTAVGPAIANNHYTILRITQNGSEMEQLYNTVTVSNSDEAFLHLTDLTQAENGKLVAILQHRYNRFLGGMPVELQSPQSGSSDRVFGNFAPESIVANELKVYPNQVSQGGLFSSLDTYRDGSQRKLLSWAKCTTIDDRNISAFCDSNSTVEEIDNRYALWVLDQGEMLPITRSEQDRVFTDITISQPHDNADFPYQAFNANFEDNLDTSRIVCVEPPVIGEPTPVPTPEPTPTVPVNPTPTPVVPPVTPTPTPIVVPPVDPTPTPIVVPTPTPVVPTPTPVVPTPTPVVPTPTPVPGTPTPTPGPVTPTPTPGPVTPTPTPGPVTPTPTPGPVTPTPTPGPVTPTPTPGPGTPTPTPTPTEPPEPVNTAPIADAGADVMTRVGLLETLDGSNSRDADGDALEYKWTVVSGSGLTLTMDDSQTPVVTASERGTFVVQLVVNDGTVDSAPDTVQVIVENTPPVADAGDDQVAVMGDVVTLDGSASGDADGDEITFAWTVVGDGEGITLQDATSAQPNVSVNANGTYQIKLIVNDGDLDSAPDLVTISAVNERPVANAGDDQKVEKDTRVELDGSASFDPEGETLSYAWTFTEVPEGVDMSFDDASAAKPAFVPSVVGTYVASLIVNDGVFDSEVDTVSITVIKTPDEVLIDCETLPQQSVQLPISFPSTKLDSGEANYPGRCTWDHAIVNGESQRGKDYDFVQGFNRQTVTPDLPQNAVVCSSKISASSGNDVYWTYDDEFFLTIGDQIIVSSESARRMQPLASADSDLDYGQGPYMWNFDAHKWQAYGYSYERYCLGQDRWGGAFADGDNPSCEFPRTQREGRFNIDIAAEDFAEVSANIVNDGGAEFSLIISGDDDPKIDCQHSGIELNWDVKYVVPPAN